MAIKGFEVDVRPHKKIVFIRHDDKAEQKITIQSLTLKNRASVEKDLKKIDLDDELEMFENFLKTKINSSDKLTKEEKEAKKLQLETVEVKAKLRGMVKDRVVFARAKGKAEIELDKIVTDLYAIVKEV